MAYYQGDYYAGDPGFLSVFKKIAGGVASFIPGVGGVVSKAISHIPAPVKRAIIKHPVLTAAGGAGVIGATGVGAVVATEPGIPSMHTGVRMIRPGVAMHPGMAGAPGMRGYHISKKTGRMVRNRRMRVTNTKALHRAIRRAQGFARVAKKVMHFVSPRAPRGRAVFRKRRRTRRAA